jgi:hypothetical protein
VVSHFQVRWHHDNPDDPVRIYEELSDERYELRKVEEFADGKLARCDRIDPDFATSLSWEPVPATVEIAAQEEFTVEPLTAEAFESVWSRASDPT